MLTVLTVSPSADNEPQVLISMLHFPTISSRCATGILTPPRQSQ